MQRQIIFDAQDLLKLLTHYTEGKVPPDAELKEFMVHPHLQRLVGMWVTSTNWPQAHASKKPYEASQGALAPLIVRYEGRKVLSWGNPQAEPQWVESPDAPKRR